MLLIVNVLKWKGVTQSHWWEIEQQSTGTSGQATQHSTVTLLLTYGSIQVTVPLTETITAYESCQKLETLRTDNSSRRKETENKATMATVFRAVLAAGSAAAASAMTYCQSVKNQKKAHQSKSECARI